MNYVEATTLFANPLLVCKEFLFSYFVMLFKCYNSANPIRLAYAKLQQKILRTKKMIGNFKNIKH
jgi:hypothetical protein